MKGTILKPITRKQYKPIKIESNTMSKYKKILRNLRGSPKLWESKTEAQAQLAEGANEGQLDRLNRDL